MNFPAIKTRGTLLPPVILDIMSCIASPSTTKKNKEINILTMQSVIYIPQTTITKQCHQETVELNINTHAPGQTFKHHCNRANVYLL